MNTEKTKVEKLESEIDAFNNLRHRRPWISYLVLIIILGPVILSVFDRLYYIPNLKKERDNLQLQLAPFLATANLKFPNAEPDKRTLTCA